MTSGWLASGLLPGIRRGYDWQGHAAGIALVIGEAHQRGRGLGTRVVADLEARVARAGAERIEVGIFAYNERSLGFFGSLGYEEFERTPPCAWWDGRLWPDVRLLKTL